MCGLVEYSANQWQSTIEEAINYVDEHQFGSGGSAQRFAQICGIKTSTGKVDKSLYGKAKDKNRSPFTCERYQFLLKAPFNVDSMCCNVMKKSPAHKYVKETGRMPITAQMASESRLRTQQWLKNGCNGFDMKRPISNPMSFWTEQDVLLYIYQNNIQIASVYGEVVKDNEVQGQLDLEDLGLFDLGAPVLKTTGAQRTGCMFCGYGCHLEPEGEGRFERMKQTHPKQYEYIMKPWEDGGLGYKDVIDWLNENGKLHIRY